MSERKLASIQKILALNPIPGADAIEVADVLGWKCVVKKGEFKVGDLCVYMEVDSVLPERPEFEFLRPRSFRIKTVKLKGQISQGICFPVSILLTPEDKYIADENPLKDSMIGFDVTHRLGVVKYEPVLHASLSGIVKGNFPNFIPKTDEERIQSSPWLLEKFANVQMVACEKLDGSSVTFYFRGVSPSVDEFGVCSRNLDLKFSEDNLFWKMAVKYEIEERMRSLGRQLAIQGELVGPTVQKNKYGLTENEVRFFSVYDIAAGKYLPHSEAKDLIEKQLYLKFVPSYWTGFLEGRSVQELIDLASFNSHLNQKVLAEGLVFRPLNEEVDVDRFGRLSFKVINPQFLLKNDE